MNELQRCVQIEHLSESTNPQISFNLLVFSTFNWQNKIANDIQNKIKLQIQTMGDAEASETWLNHTWLFLVSSCSSNHNYHRDSKNQNLKCGRFFQSQSDCLPTSYFPHLPTNLQKALAFEPAPSVFWSLPRQSATAYHNPELAIVNRCVSEQSSGPPSGPHFPRELGENENMHHPGVPKDWSE